jgi:autotransporter-associated beta strand protein
MNFSASFSFEQTVSIFLLGLAMGAKDAAAGTRPMGTDVSSYQGGSLNWTNIRNDGISFAWTKATEGTYYEDADFAINESHAKAAGVMIGAYHFARPSDDPNITGANSADTEAQYFWNFAGGYVVAGGGYLVPMLDWEDVYVTNAGLNFTAAKLSQWANEWCNDVSNYAHAAGVTIKPVIYTGSWFSAPGTYPGLNTTVTNWPSWLSDYPSCTGSACGSPTPQTSAPSDIYPWTTWDIWQYGDTNWSGGDADVFNGSTNQFLQLFLVGNTNAPTPSAPAGAAVYWNPAAKTFASPGTGGTGYWDTGTTNWWYSGSSNVAFSTGGDNPVFAGTAGTVTLATSATAGSVTFDTAGYDVTGTSATLTLNSPGTISIPAGSATYLQCILGGVGYTLSGGGILVLNNTNNYSGSSLSAETVNGPNTTLVVMSDHDTGNDGVTLNLENGGIYQNNDTTAGDQFLLTGCAIALLSGGGIFDNPNASLTMSNYITGSGSLTTTGVSGYVLTLTDTGNNYSGGTIVKGPGTLKANTAGTLGSTSAALTVNGGVLDLGGASHTAGSLTITGGTLQDGTLTAGSYAVQGGTISAILAGSKAVTKTTSTTATLSGANTYTGYTTISVGTLALGSSGSINNSSTISIAAGAAFDVSAISAYALSANNTVTASGTTNAATIKGGTTVNFGSRPVTLTYDGSDPALGISKGTLVLNGNAFTVNGTQPTTPGSYTLIQQASGNISGTGSFTVAGTAVGAAGTTAAISVSGGSVILTITDTTATTLNTLTPSTYGQSVTFTASVVPAPSGGTVQFYDNAVALGGPVAVSGGTASYATSLLAVGNHPITASYSGVSGYAASSTGGASTQQVNAAALSVTANAQSTTYGVSLTFGSGCTQFTSVGLQNGETIGSVTLTVSNGGDQTNAPVGTYIITPSQATGGTFAPGNYNIAYITNTLTVTLPPNTIPVTITNIVLLDDGTIQLDCNGTPGYVYLIEAAPDLTPPISWTTLDTNAADTNGDFEFIDTDATNYSGRYYRTATQ